MPIAQSLPGKRYGVKYPLRGFRPAFFEGLNRAYLPTFTGEEGYRLGLGLVRRPEEKRTFQAGRRDRGNVVPRRKERAQVAGVQLAGAHQAFAMPSHLPKRLYETFTSSPTFGWYGHWLSLASIVRHIRPDFLFPVFLSDLLDFPLKIEYLRNPKFATFFA